MNNCSHFVNGLNGFAIDLVPTHIYIYIYMYKYNRCNWTIGGLLVDKWYQFLGAGGRTNGTCFSHKHIYKA